MTMESLGIIYALGHAVILCIYTIAILTAAVRDWPRPKKRIRLLIALGCLASVWPIWFVLVAVQWAEKTINEELLRKGL